MTGGVSAGLFWAIPCRLLPVVALAHYVDQGVHELDQDKLTPLLRLRYNNSIADAIAELGRPQEIGEVFSGFQQYLYQGVA